MPKRIRKQDKPGRPKTDEYKDVVRKAITVQYPEELISYIDSVTDNRTKWIVETLEARRKQEQER